MTPLVSIIVPVYNGARYLENFINSIVSQTYQNIEVIIIDDGSTDNSLEIINNLKPLLEEKNIRLVILSKSNGGQASAINLGLKYVEGKYLVWVDCDDILLPQNIEKKVNFLEEHKEYAFVMCAAEEVELTDFSKILSIKKRKIYKGGEDNLFNDLVFGTNVIFVPGVYMANFELLKKVIPENGIYESREGQNYQLLLPLAYSYRCGYIDDVLFRIVSHSDSHSRMNRTYKEIITRFSNIEELMFNVFETIPSMSIDDCLYWKKVNHIKFLRRKIYISYEYKMMSEARLYRNELSQITKKYVLRTSYIVYRIKKIIRGY